MDHPTFPNETAAYRQARNQLLEAEAKLRDQLEKVAALRRELPVGGAIKEDYVFDELDEDGAVTQVRLSDLFAPGKDSLFLYGYMFGPGAERPCPLCTSFLDSLDGNTLHLEQQINVAVVARSPIRRIKEVGSSRGWRRLRLLSSANNSYQADYLAEGEDGNQWPMANVFVKRGKVVHHSWGSELLFRSYAGGDMRHIDLLWPLWNVFDLTPEGRGQDWYPSLSYER
jgi:predicted dithiol-disulfide oxidoreductase (DUF899 family)